MQRVCLAIVLLTLFRPAISRADEAAEPAPDPELYRCRPSTAETEMTFKPEMELKELVTWAIGLTCKSFMLDPKIIPVGRKVNLIAPGKMTHAEAYNMFLAALSTVGLTVVPKGKGYRIVEVQLARGQALPIYSKTPPDDTDQVVRYVVRPTYARAETLMKAFQAVRSEAGDIQQIGSLVLITDFGSSVRSMMTLAKLIDVPEGTDAIYTLPVKHADATKLVDKINTILGLTAGAKADPGAAPAGSLAAPSKMLVDERTNTLVMAGTAAAFQRVQALVERLDISLDIEGGAAIHVYKLKSAIAESLAAVLNQAIQPSSKADKPPAATGALPQVGEEPHLTGDAKVIAEKESNSLIVLSSGRDFLAIKEIIQQLDQPRRQVYIEGLIVEIDISNDLETGVSAHGLLPTGSGTSVLVGGVQTGGGVSSTDPKSLANATGLLAGVMSSASATLLGTTIPTYGALFTALSTKTNSNVMQMPSMIALDNEQTHYTIGTNIPYKRGLSYGGLNGTTPAGSTTVNIDRKDLQLKLDIKPHISDEETVLLEIDHKAEDLGDAGGDLGPTWNTREMKTNVVVRDQQTVVIGGLISEKEYVVKTAVPILGDIPVIGTLFRHTLKQKRKSKLVILLTPYIIHDRLDFEAIRSRMQRSDEFIRSFHALDGMAYQPHVDYRLKRGLVEEINRAVTGVEEDAAALRALNAPVSVKTGPL